jgi:hypothetical protein
VEVNIGIFVVPEKFYGEIVIRNSFDGTFRRNAAYPFIIDYDKADNVNSFNLGLERGAVDLLR